MNGEFPTAKRYPAVEAFVWVSAPVLGFAFGAVLEGVGLLIAALNPIRNALEQLERDQHAQ